MDADQFQNISNSDDLQVGKVLVGDGSNFQSIEDSNQFYKRPMQLTAWTQTTAEDFGCLTQVEMHMPRQRESELLNKIRVLEESLREHSELLSHINATSKRTSAILGKTCDTSMQQHDEAVASTPLTSNKAEASNAVGVIVSRDSVQDTDVPMSSPPDSGIRYSAIAKPNTIAEPQPVDFHINIDGVISNVSSIQTPTTENISFRSENYKKPYNMEENENLCSNITVFRNSNDRNILHTPYNRNDRSNKKRKVPKSKKPCPPIEIDENFVPAFYNCEDFKVNDIQEKDLQDLVSLGPNNTHIPAKIFDSIKWHMPTAATRKLLMVIFGREILATHSMTGRPSPAFINQQKPPKKRLNPLIVQDVIFAVTRKCNVSEKEVRSSITTKCADENKMVKLRENKKAALKQLNKDTATIPPKKKYLLNSNFTKSFD